ncbi:hypothetical protein GJ744_010011 [Endocarpon pusillum]|uniref:LysM domain-containing protein n=1 Tax=Endocarpon pusillum TaxID=364733 RepID=A0A8H7AIY5_9EURO|nr:hypothetical protein GJ744_010011 [Endocarpon pusillum]
MAMADVYLTLQNASLQQSICDPRCGTELSEHRSSVASACASDPMPWQGIPATYLPDLVWAYYNSICLKDPSTGRWCVDYVSDITSSLTSDMDLLDLPRTQLCSPCIIALFKHQQSTPFSNFDEHMSSQWASVQRVCGVTGSTAVPTPYATPTELPGHAPPNSSQTTPFCLSGKKYKVVSGDDIQKIAEAKKVATGTLRIINDILPDGSNLLAGQELCLPESCTTLIVQPGDTCWALASAKGLRFSDILAYNPSINSDCSNLISGTNICVSLPGELYNGTVIPGATVTQTAIFATATAAIPSNAAPGSTRKCGKWYTVQSGDYCQIVALNHTIALDLFLAINPSVNSTCGNLVLGVAYCVYPTADWNATSTVIVPAPTTTPKGSTSQCYQWHVIESGDTCHRVEQAYEITMAQLQAWNPDLRDDCSNLQLGLAYCVSGPRGVGTSTGAVLPTGIRGRPPSSTSSPTSNSLPGGNSLAGPPSIVVPSCNHGILQKQGESCYDPAAGWGYTLSRVFDWIRTFYGRVFVVQ